jgi:flagellar motor switch protein FliN/FliY
MSTADVLNRFEGLPFLLEVDVGSFDMSIRDILALQPGAILRTNHAAGVPLTLRAGGSPIAAVEVMLVEDALAVRVKNMLPASASSSSPQAS